MGEEYTVNKTIGWWCRDLNDKVFGQYSLNTMRGYLEQRIINPDTMVRHNTEDEWRPAGEVEELQAPPAGSGMGGEALVARNKRNEWQKAAEAETHCIKHRDKLAITVCYRCHAPVCSKDLYKPNQWMCKPCHNYLYNRRTLAGIVDYIILPYLLIFLTVLPMGMLAVFRNSPLAMKSYMGVSYASMILILIYVLFKDYLFKGRSIGKLAAAIQVVDEKTKEPCTLVQSMKRNSNYCFSWVPVIGFFMALFWLVDVSRAYYEERERRWTDQWAGTIVVDIPGKVEAAREKVRKKLSGG
ncbi:MAG: RDD family protein [Candidatus Eremiobacteraeota bacterium]|nr:RDD family protein [Candidatus Eremiobacteraeota bacterium]